MVNCALHSSDASVAPLRADRPPSVSQPGIREPSSSLAAPGAPLPGFGHPPPTAWECSHSPEFEPSVQRQSVSPQKKLLTSYPAQGPKAVPTQVLS